MDIEAPHFQTSLHITRNDYTEPQRLISIPGPPRLGISGPNALVVSSRGRVLEFFIEIQ